MSEYLKKFANNKAKKVPLNSYILTVAQTLATLSLMYGYIKLSMLYPHYTGMAILCLGLVFISYHWICFFKNNS